MKERLPCKICGEKASGTWIAADGEYILVCVEHLDMLSDNKRGVWHRIKDAWHSPSGMKPATYKKMPKKTKLYIYAMFIIWIFTGVFGVYWSGRGVSLQLVGGWIGQILIMIGVVFLIGVIYGKERFWSEWIETGEFGGKRLYYAYWILGIICVVVPLLLWAFGIIHIVDLTELTRK